MIKEFGIGVFWLILIGIVVGKADETVRLLRQFGNTFTASVQTLQGR